MQLKLFYIVFRFYYEFVLNIDKKKKNFSMFISYFSVKFLTFMSLGYSWAISKAFQKSAKYEWLFL